MPRSDHTDSESAEGSARECILLLGNGSLADATQRALEASGAEVQRLCDPGDDDIRKALGEGGSHFLLRRLSLKRARALAAVTSDEVRNIAVVGAALGIRDDLRSLLRAGRGEVANETQSLFKLGIVRDVNRIGGTLLAAAALGSEAKEAFLHEQTVYLVMPDGEDRALR